jgi:hypothetical protein
MSSPIFRRFVEKAKIRRRATTKKAKDHKENTHYNYNNNNKKINEDKDYNNDED